MTAPLHEPRAAEHRAAQRERELIARWLRMPIEIPPQPALAALPIPPGALAEFVSMITRGIAEVIEKGGYPR